MLIYKQYRRQRTKRTASTVVCAASLVLFFVAPLYDVTSGSIFISIERKLCVVFVEGRCVYFGVGSYGCVFALWSNGNTGVLSG